MIIKLNSWPFVLIMAAITTVATYAAIYGIWMPEYVRSSDSWMFVSEPYGERLASLRLIAASVAALAGGLVVTWGLMLNAGRTFRLELSVSDNNIKR